VALVDQVCHLHRLGLVVQAAGQDSIAVGTDGDKPRWAGGPVVGVVTEGGDEQAARAEHARRVTEQLIDGCR